MDQPRGQRTLVVVVVVVVLLCVLWWWWRRRQQQQLSTKSDPVSPPEPTPVLHNADFAQHDPYPVGQATWMYGVPYEWSKFGERGAILLARGEVPELALDPAASGLPGDTHYVGLRYVQAAISQTIRSLVPHRTYTLRLWCAFQDNLCILGVTVEGTGLETYARPTKPGVFRAFEYSFTAQEESHRLILRNGGGGTGSMTMFVARLSVHP